MRTKANRFYNIFHGFVVDSKSKKKIFFHTAGNMVKAIEKLYSEAEK
jgi:hypothetical protein